MVAPTVSAVMEQMKGSVTKQAGFPIWQKGLQNHVIRSEADYRKIWNCIQNNPTAWEEDRLFVKA